MKEIHVLNLGAGVQSTALALLSAEGRIRRMDYAVFADTGEEPVDHGESVYQHLEWLVPRLPFPVLIKSKGRLGDHLMNGVNNTGGRFASIPAFTLRPDGTEGKVRRQCTREYKLEVVERAIRRDILGLAPRKHIPRDVMVHQYIGISLDEIGRMHSAKRRAEERGSPRWSTLHYPFCEELMWTRADCRAYLKPIVPHRVPRSACTFCLDGNTDVITRSGTRKIRDLVGASPELLVPSRNGKSWSNHGKWQECQVRSFGEQKCLGILLRRGRSIKKVVCSEDHRWVSGGEFVMASELRVGQRLDICSRPSVACSTKPVRVSIIGVQHGFTFGDGTRQEGRCGPASARLYGQKDKAMIKWFNGHPIKRVRANGGIALEIVGLPRYWKDLPPITESRSYLLGFLAGYFAADGTVSGRGSQATLCSRNESSLQWVRDACYELGIRTSPIIKKMRVGFGVNRKIYSVSIRVRDIPKSFWIMNHHADRVDSRDVGEYARNAWVVSKVWRAGLREVFCATVQGSERFTLADNLLTGNCPFHSNEEWQRIKLRNGADWKRVVEIDRALRRPGNVVNRKLEQQMFLHRSCRPIDEIDFTQEGDVEMAAECEGMCGS